MPVLVTDPPLAEEPCGVPLEHKDTLTPCMLFNVLLAILGMAELS